MGRQQTHLINLDKQTHLINLDQQIYFMYYYIF